MSLAPKTVDVPMPGDGKYWEQTIRNGEPEYVFYTPAHRNIITNAESLNYDKFNLGGDEKKPINYYPMKNLPWPEIGEPTEPGDNLFDDVRRFVYDHVDFSDPRTYDVKAAWILATWTPEKFNTAPYWRYLGPPNVGKTRALEVDQQLCFRACLSPSITEAALFRLIEQYRITYLLDETEVYSNEQKQAVQHVLNSGYRRGQQVFRCEQTASGEMVVAGFSPFGFKALAGTRVLKTTLESRCILTVMQKNTRQINFMLDTPRAKNLRSRLLMWRFRQLAKLDLISEGSEGSEGGEGYLEAPPSLHSVKNSRIVELFAPLILMAPNDEIQDTVVSFAVDFYKDTQEEDSSGAEALILDAILSTSDRLQSGKFATSWVVEHFNGSKPEKEHWRSGSVGKLIKSLGFKPKRMSGGKSGYIYDVELLDRLSERYAPPLESPSPPSLPSLLSPNMPNLREKCNRIIELLGELDHSASTSEMFEVWSDEIGLADVEELNKILLVMNRDGAIYQPTPGYWEVS